MKARVNALNRRVLDGAITLDAYTAECRALLSSITNMNQKIIISNMLYVSV